MFYVFVVFGPDDEPDDEPDDGYNGTPTENTFLTNVSWFCRLPNPMMNPMMDPMTDPMMDLALTEPWPWPRPIRDRGHGHVAVSVAEP